MQVEIKKSRKAETCDIGAKLIPLLFVLIFSIGANTTLGIRVELFNLSRRVRIYRMICFYGH